MIDTSMSGITYNRFENLDGIEDRIIYYLLSEKNKTQEELNQVHTIWRILYYNDVDALIEDEEHPLPSYKEVCKLISNNNKVDQSDKRVFRSPRMEDAWTQECSLLKIYVDSIVPVNHLRSIVNVGIDIVVNSKIINLAVPDESRSIWIDEEAEIGSTITVATKSRVTALAQCILSLLNGAQVQGVGKMIFSREQSIFNQAQYGLWNNRNFEGIKIVMGVSISGVS